MDKTTVTVLRRAFLIPCRNERYRRLEPTPGRDGWTIKSFAHAADEDLASRRIAEQKGRLELLTMQRADFCRQDRWVAYDASKFGAERKTK